MASKKRRKSEPAPGWAWMLFGLSIGLSVALVVYLINGPSRVPEDVRETFALTEPADPPRTQSEAIEEETVAATDISPGAQPEEEEEIAFSFHDLLEDSVVVVPESEPDDRLNPDSASDFIIQAGSFPTIQGADSRQADVALLGFESSIESAIVRDRLVHRVIIGPISDRGEISRTRRRLESMEIETLLRALPN